MLRWLPNFFNGALSYMYVLLIFLMSRLDQSLKKFSDLHNNNSNWPSAIVTCASILVKKTDNGKISDLPRNLH